MQAFREELIDAALAGERALFYAFGFALEGFAVHHMLPPPVLADFSSLPQGSRCFCIAWELVEHVYASS